MPTVTQEFDRARARIHDLPAEICKQGGEVMRASLLKSLDTVTHGSRRLRNVWWQTFLLDVDVKVEGSPDKSTALLAPKPLRGGGALWSWLEFGTRPHAVGISRSGKRKRMRIEGHWVTGPTRPTVRLPAKFAWTVGVNDGRPLVIERVEELMREALHGR